MLNLLVGRLGLWAGFGGMKDWVVSDGGRPSAGGVGLV